MMKERATGHFLILVSALIFAFNYPISKWLLSNYLTPDFYISVRMLASCVLFWGLSLFLPGEPLSRKELGIFFLCALGGITGNQFLFIWGLSQTSPIDASVIMTARPIMVLVLSALILREAISRPKAAGVLLGAAGAAWLIIRSASPADGNASSSLSGNLLVFFSGIVYALYFVFSKPLSEKYQATTMMKWMFLFAAIQVLPFTLPAIIEAETLFLAQPDAKAWAAIAFVLFGTSFLGYLLIPMAVRRIRPTSASMYNTLHPIVAFFLAALLMQDVITFEKILATLAVAAGLYIVTLCESREFPEKKND